MFASVYHVFEKETPTIGGDVKENETARHMMRKMVNSMTAKMEIGSPMASMYLLGHPDHYSSHDFVAFPWRSYVSFVRSFWTKKMDLVIEADDDDAGEDSVPIGRQDGRYIASSGVDDYKYRPVVYNNVSLYEWIQCYARRARTKEERKEFDQEVEASKYLRPEWHKAAIQQLSPDKPMNEDDLEDERIKTTIPNFIGGAVPRSDKGDRTYYCLTM
ncbi:hypothetical protein B0H19DRAFT_873251, partial [Mycena capillaripes]